MGIGMGALVAGLFGMNVRFPVPLRPAPSRPHRPHPDVPAAQLKSHLEEAPYAFGLMSGAAFVVTALVSLAGLRRSVPAVLLPAADVRIAPRLTKIRKVGLSAGSGAKKARPWIPLPLRRPGAEERY